MIKIMTALAIAILLAWVLGYIVASILGWIAKLLSKETPSSTILITGRAAGSSGNAVRSIRMFK